MSLSEPRRQQISKLMAQNPQECLAIAKKVTLKLIESHLVEGGMRRGEEIDRRHNMADELNDQKGFLTWAKSAAVIQTDARQGIARPATFTGYTLPARPWRTDGRGHRLLLDAARRTTK